MIGPVKTIWGDLGHRRAHTPTPSVSQNEDEAYRKFRLRVEDVQGKNCLTNFWVSSQDTIQHGRKCVQHAQCWSITA